MIRATTIRPMEAGLHPSRRAAMNVEILPAADAHAWNGVFESCHSYDVYHLAEYHRLAERAGEGEARLLVFRDGPRIVAWPLLVRPLSSVQGLGLESSDLNDATSVYGYPGPVSTPEALADGVFLDRVADEFARVAGDLRLVSAFTRLNPLLNGGAVCRHLGRLVEMGPTVSIDLLLSDEDRLMQYRHSHRYEVRKARKSGLRVFRDDTWAHFDDFSRLYSETMRRAGASKRYFFSPEHFRGLKDALGDRLSLFVVMDDGMVASAALFTETSRIVQYYLSGSDARFRKFAPSKLLLDEACIWAKSRHAKRLHIGGGFGASHDTLFQFKSGFSHTRHRFFVWQWIGMPAVYDDLVARARANGDSHADASPAPGFFPAYRA